MNKLALLKLETLTKSPGIYRSLYEQIRDQVLSGKLLAGARLPSTRSLAAELGCSRGSVERAYELLLAEGLIQGEGAAGTRVNPKLDQSVIGTGVLGHASRGSPLRILPPTHPKPFALQMGLPALDAFPRKLWNRLINKHSRSMGSDLYSGNTFFGYEPLRQALSNYLAISRGVTAEPEQIFITAGFQGALTMIIQCLADPGDQVWCEDPGYFRARDCLNQMGVTVIPVPVDGDGIKVEEGIQLASSAKFALVTPTHQSPTGVPLSLARRMELLHWAASQDRWIIEDDYDSEFRYSGKPLPALKSLDGNHRVIYTGSFSKVLLPSLQLGYMVVPRQLIPQFEDCFSSLWSTGSLLEQKVVTEFMMESHFSLHIKKMRKLYGERRAALATALQERLPGQLSVSLQAGGMHLIGELLNVKDESLLQCNVEALGISPHFLSSFQVQAPQASALLLGFTNVDVNSATEVADKLALAIKRSL